MTNYRGLFVGLTTVDIQYYVEQFPEPNIKIKSEAPSILIGGPATNAAVAFSALNGGAHLATAVGDNAFTSLVKSDFNTNNIILNDIAENQNISPVLASVITSLNGDRTILTHNPTEVNANLKVSELFETVKPQVVMLDGFNPGFSVECAATAKEKGIPVVIDCGSWKPQYSEILKYTDIVICSADFYPPACDSPQQVFSYLKNYGIKYSAISRGEKSILFQENENKGEIRVDEVKVVDTLGAGDFLHGAFCYYWLENFSFEKALKMASEIAGFSCRFRGTRSWINKRKIMN